MSDQQKPTMTELNPPERKRTYVFPGGERLELNDVTHIEVRTSGKHRVQTKDGRKVWVNTGWLWIELDVDEWTF